MFAKISAAAISGYEAVTVLVETDITSGLPGFDIVGLPDTSVTESRLRVRSAMGHADIKMPAGKIVVNMAPADLRKEGSGLDLPIVISICCAMGTIPEAAAQKYLFVGELGLNGELRHTKAVLPIALLALQMGFTGIVLPAENAREAMVVPDIEVLPFASLSDIISFFSGNLAARPVLPAANQDTPQPESLFSTIDMSEIKGQLLPRRALEIAAAGGHNLLFSGPPGSGKTMLARALPSILPPPDFIEALEVTRIYSIKGLLPAGAGLIKQRPFRDPHHTISDVALIGGGRVPAPGEVSLAHHGVLFLDELPEFQKNVLEVLREPLSSGFVSISRAAQTCRFPARFLFVAAMNPCPCGFSTDPYADCICTGRQIAKYRQKLSGPLLDRIDLQVQVPRLQPWELADKPEGESSAVVRERVIKARNIQKQRNSTNEAVLLNAHLSGTHLSAVCKIDGESKKLLVSAARKFQLSARGYDKVIKIARTIADLDNSEEITGGHLAEALQYRTGSIFDTETSPLIPQEILQGETNNGSD